MADTIPEKIIAECAIAFADNSDDCNKYVKAVAAVFFEPDLFSGPGMNADAIIREMISSSEWTRLGKSHPNAILDAKAGRFVVAGMTSTELDSAHGHLAIVIGVDGQNSGSVLVPICYAGSLNANARVQNRRVSETFGATFARTSKISYFSRVPQSVPTLTAISRLVEHMAGIRVEPAVMPHKTGKRNKRKSAADSASKEAAKGRAKQAPAQK